MTPCSCQTSGHDPGCPNHLGGFYVDGVIVGPFTGAIALLREVAALREVELAARYVVLSWGEPDADEDSFSTDLRKALAALDAGKATP